MTSHSGHRKRERPSEDDGQENKRKRGNTRTKTAKEPTRPTAKEPTQATEHQPTMELSASWSAVSTEVQRLSSVMPKMKNVKIETPEACAHEVVFPEGVVYHPLVQSDKPPAREYKFTLDPFQKEAVMCIENHQSVLVSAHTSAGKTVVAEYAIALSMKKRQRVIYTTPIKALSNQKYFELSAEFGDVGLMTGDITINEDATCLVMTTEILRSMLYRGSEVMREMAWVVFDEIHYMRDKERGVVWEETIILIPDAVRFVFLSATIPNARQFAEWVSYLHQQPCHVVYTDYRPTPLQHYIFPSGDDGIHLVVDENGVFRESNFSSAMSILMDGDAGKGDQRGRRGGFKGESNCFKIVKLVMEKDMAPLIVFSFSKRDCEDYAKEMSKLVFTTSAEEALVVEIFQNAIDYTLSDDEKELPQVKGILPLLKKGIGIHHSGLLPVLKETVEILFSEGLIKALFATETFAMGLNMPARTVLFTSAQKFDGKDFRWISSGEYIQMSGRAGRRGIDNRGIVILMVDSKMSPGICQQIIKGQADPLYSAFRVTYSMILNLLRMQEINPEYMLEKSFYNFQNYASILEVVKKMDAMKEKQKAITVDNESDFVTFEAIQKQQKRLTMKLATYINKPKYIVPFMKPGRLVKVVHNTHDFGWCVVTSIPQVQKLTKMGDGKKQRNMFDELVEIANILCPQSTPSTQKQKDDAKSSDKNEEALHTVEVLMLLSKETCEEKSLAAMKPCPAGDKGQMSLVKVELNCIVEISAIRLEKLPQDLKSPANRAKVLKDLQVVLRKFPSGVTLLDPIKDMKIKDEEVATIVSKMADCRVRLAEHPFSKSDQLPAFSEEYHSKLKMQSDIETLKTELKRHPYFVQLEELKCRKRILRLFGYAKPGDIIQLKGHAACEISSGDEILTTELLFNGVFNDLTPEEACSLLSCLVFQESSAEKPPLSNELNNILRKMQDVARDIAKKSINARLPMEEEKYIESFRPDMMEVVNAWCKGSSFSQICEITQIHEGSIIRCMRRLQEALLQLFQASKSIGNPELEMKFCKGIAMVKRNIVNACSLYLPKEI